MKACTAMTIALAAIVLPGGCSREAESQGETRPLPKVTASAPQTEARSSSAPAPTTPVARDAINDSIITSRIKAGILSDPGMAGTDVSVNTDHGVVSLTGIIKSQEQAAIASAHAQRQDGVMRVDNMLAVNLH